jgi:hypothetical protein
VTVTVATQVSRRRREEPADCAEHFATRFERLAELPVGDWIKTGAIEHAVAIAVRSLVEDERTGTEMDV